MAISGRFSRYPAINREVPSVEGDWPERAAQGEPWHVESIDVIVVVPEDMSVNKTLAWAGSDSGRRAAALLFEKAKDEPRKGILKVLDLG